MTDFRQKYNDALGFAEESLRMASLELSEDRLFPRPRIALTQAENAVRWLVEAERLARAIEESEGRGDAEN